MTRKKPNGKRDRQKAKDATSRPDTWSREPKKQRLEEPAESVRDGIVAEAAPDQMPSIGSNKDVADDIDKTEGEPNVPPTES